MDNQEKKKAIKGVMLAAMVGLPFLAIANIKLSPETVSAIQTARAPSTTVSSQAVNPDSSETDPEVDPGEHCLSGWDGSFPALKEAVKRQLRNPRSFEHVETVRSPVDEKGTFGLIMTYRAENGFGGMNVDAVGVEVDADTCRFRRASTESLEDRLTRSTN